jgi:hypothetical protein
MAKTKKKNRDWFDMYSESMSYANEAAKLLQAMVSDGDCGNFENVASQIGNNRRICELATEKLIRLRDTLLPLLMNGQVEVR